MSLALLWAVLLHGTASYAYAAPNVGQNSSAKVAQGETLSSDSDITDLQQGMLYLAQEGTASTLTFSLQSVATVTRIQTIWFSSHEAIPPYAARAPGDSFFCKFFYTSSQPQAP